MKEMKLTFREYLKYNEPDYEISEVFENTSSISGRKVESN
jgi:hypothetical protein